MVGGDGGGEGAKEVGLDQVTTVRLSDMGEAEIRAYVIADNRLAENAGWDRALLGLELQYLTELDIDFDVTVTGFELHSSIWRAILSTARSIFSAWTGGIARK